MSTTAGARTTTLTRVIQAAAAPRRARPLALLTGTLLLFAFTPAAAPAASNTIMETVLLTVLAAVNAAIALTGSGAQGKTAQVTGITAGLVLILACTALISHGQPAAGTYMLTCYGLAQAGTGFIHEGLPARPAI